jgi:hypothetical protein
VNIIARLIYVFVGPVALTGAALLSGTARIWLFIAGGLATFLGFSLAELTLSQTAKQSILDTAVDFLHASGIKDVRANFMSLQRHGVLKMKYLSTAYRDFERNQNWRKGDGSCASTALEERVPVLGGHQGELVPRINVDFSMRIMTMKILDNEEIKSVLCVPVFHGDGHDAVGVITFDDILPLNQSQLASPDILRVAKDLGRTFLRAR